MTAPVAESGDGQTRVISFVMPFEYMLEYAGYNAPFSAPWLNRHEVMVEIE